MVYLSYGFSFTLSVGFVFEREASAAKTYKIVVKINAKNIDARSGVSVQVTGGSLTTPKTATTSKTGIAKFTKLPKGTYTVTPTKEGYSFEPESMEVTFTKRRRKIVTFLSKPSGTTELGILEGSVTYVGPVSDSSACKLYN